jgi:hypothetical protein
MSNSQKPIDKELLQRWLKKLALNPVEKWTSNLE